MSSEFSRLLQARHQARRRNRRAMVVVGLLLLALGYALLAVSPETESVWVLMRAFGGMACIVVGFGMAIVPLLSGWLTED
jgi:hypothetical protein